MSASSGITRKAFSRKQAKAYEKARTQGREARRHKYLTSFVDYISGGELPTEVRFTFPTDQQIPTIEVDDFAAIYKVYNLCREINVGTAFSKEPASIPTSFHRYGILYLAAKLRALEILDGLPNILEYMRQGEHNIAKAIEYTRLVHDRGTRVIKELNSLVGEEGVESGGKVNEMYAIYDKKLAEISDPAALKRAHVEFRINNFGISFPGDPPELVEIHKERIALAEEAERKLNEEDRLKREAARRAIEQKLEQEYAERKERLIREQREAEERQRYEEWLQTPEGQEYDRKREERLEQIRLAMEAQKAAKEAAEEAERQAFAEKQRQKEQLEIQKSKELVRRTNEQIQREREEEFARLDAERAKLAAVKAAEEAERERRLQEYQANPDAFWDTPEKPSSSSRKSKKSKKTKDTKKTKKASTSSSKSRTGKKK